jgi:hypothetical protein
MNRPRLQVRQRASADFPFKSWAPKELLPLHRAEKGRARENDSSRLRLIEKLGSHQEMKAVWGDLLITHKRKFTANLEQSGKGGKTSKPHVGIGAEIRILQVRDLIDACENAQKTSSLVDLVCSAETRKFYEKTSRTAEALSKSATKVIDAMQQKLNRGLSSELSKKKSAAMVSKVMTEILQRTGYGIHELADYRSAYIDAISNSSVDFGVPIPVVRSAMANLMLRASLSSLKIIAEYAQSPTGQAWTWRKKEQQRTARIQFQVELWGYFKHAYGKPLHNCIAAVTQAVANIGHLTGKNVAKSIERYFETNSV